MATRKYGWRPPHPDQLKAAPKYKVCPRLRANLPAFVDLHAKFPAVFDQGELGSCTANMSAGMIVYDQAIQGLPIVTPSRLFDYYNSRALEGTTSEDSGASITDAVKAIAQYGQCPESEWPYDISKFANKPSAQCYSDALPNKVSDYFNVNQSAGDIKSALATGEPVGFGFVVYPSFESDAVAKSGICPMPSMQDKIQGSVGGHAVLLVGYDDKSQCFMVRNSWGASWGQHGYFWMPYQYVLDSSLASDFWIIRTIPGGTPQPPQPPTPPNPPTPPTPAPNVLQQVIDNLFAQLEAQLTGRPLLLDLVKQLQAVIDALFAPPAQRALLGGITPADVKKLADWVIEKLQAAFIGNTEVEGILTLLKLAIDSLLQAA